MSNNSIDPVLLSGKEYESHSIFWKGVFDNITDHNKLIEKPTKSSREAQDFQTFSLNLPKDITENLKQKSRGNPISIAILTMAGLDIVLQRYTGNNTVAVQLPLLKDSQINGITNNILLKSTRIDSSMTIKDLIQQVKEQVSLSYQYSDYPLELASITPEYINEATNVCFYAPEIHAEISDTAITQIDCLLGFQSVDQEIQLFAKYRAEQYDSIFWEQFLNHWTNTLAYFNQLDTPLGQLDFFLEAEKENLRYLQHPEPVDFPYNNILDLFSLQVAKNPEARAIVYDSQTFTYGWLDKKSSKLAHFLIENHGVGKGKIVCLLAEKSERMLVCMLAILKAGGAYCAIDPTIPSERISFMLEDSQAEMLIIDSKFMFSIGEFAGDVFVADLQLDTLPDPPDSTTSPVSPEQAAYLIYTSGSTGKPKGVLVSHGSFANTLNWRVSQYGFGPEHTHLQFFSFAFDGSITDTYSSLISGGCLVIVDDDMKGDAIAIAGIIESQKVSHMIMVPSFYDLIIEALNIEDTHLQAVTVAGEALGHKTREKHFAKFPQIRLVNEYGPTENTVCSTFMEIGPDTDISIGKPITHVSAYILDSNLQHVPMGVAGELYLGGKGLALGYWNNEALTNQKFINNPFSEIEKIYKTGDLVKVNRDGNILFIGRADQQVKIRGYRIELEEIKGHILTHPQIREACIITRKSKQGAGEIIAYYVAENQLNTSELKSFLKRVVPDYMVPAFLIRLESIPLTAIGKIDSKKLPEPESVIAEETKYIPPETATQKKLADIWESIFRKYPLGIQEDFFDLGGNSLIATQIVIRINKEFNIKIELGAIFENPTIELLAEIIASSPRIGYDEIQVIEEDNLYDVSHGQKRLWILDQLEEEQNAYAISSAFAINGSLDEAYLKKAIETVVNRHEIFRTTFVMENGVLKQKIAPPFSNPVDFSIENLAGTPAKEAKRDEIISSVIETPFDLKKGPLLKIKLIKADEEKYWIVFNIHHIIADAWSLKIFVQELSTCYNAFIKHEKPVLDELTLQYKDYAYDQLRKTDSEAFRKERQYWQEKLKGLDGRLDLPFDKARPPIKTFNGDVRFIQLDRQTKDELTQFSKRHDATMFMTLLATVQAFLHRYTQQTDLAIGTPIAGRNNTDLENQIGFYTNTLTLRTQFDPEDRFVDLLQKAKKKPR